jgi:hypothetical protein
MLRLAGRPRIAGLVALKLKGASKSEAKDRVALSPPLVLTWDRRSLLCKDGQASILQAST